MAGDSDYVHVDEEGVMRVGTGRVMLDGVVYAFNRGESPESIRAQFPALTLEEVYGAITYCLAHGAEVQDYLRRQEAVVQHWRQVTEQVASPMIDRLKQATKAGIREE
jgi:uncharacterized protein (DUF433 family)